VSLTEECDSRGEVCFDHRQMREIYNYILEYAKKMKFNVADPFCVAHKLYIVLYLILMDFYVPLVEICLHVGKHQGVQKNLS